MLDLYSFIRAELEHTVCLLYVAPRHVAQMPKGNSGKKNGFWPSFNGWCASDRSHAVFPTQNRRIGVRWGEESLWDKEREVESIIETVLVLYKKKYRSVDNWTHNILVSVRTFSLINDYETGGELCHFIILLNIIPQGSGVPRLRISWTSHTWSALLHGEPQASRRSSAPTTRTGSPLKRAQ